MTCPTITTMHAILAAYDAPAGPSKADTIKAVAECLGGACAAPQCDPGVKQLSAQLEDDEKWTPEEQRQFAVFLRRFPNESSAGIISLGSAWKHGKAIAQPVAAQGAQDAALDSVLYDAMAEQLGDLYHCGRVWSAWSVGTMSEDDFSIASEDDDIVANFVSAARAAIVAAKGGAQ